MPESPKAELVFQYVRDADDVYYGSADVHDGLTSTSDRPPMAVALTRPEWVRFVVDTIRQHKEINKVAFTLTKTDHSTHRHFLDSRTIERIKDSSLEADDLIL